VIYLLTLGGACFGSWKAALYWNNRTRDARSGDIRDQEIRELTAALNVARKKVEKLDNRSGSSAQELSLLQDEARKTTAELAECQQKIVVAEAAVTREIETREALDTRIAQMHRELDTAKSRVAELEVQVKIVSPSSGLVAGLDDLFEDDEKEVFTIRHEHKVFKQQVAELEQAMVVEKAESARWKQHCNVMGKTNKTLRQRTDELTQQLSVLDDLKAKAAQLLTATADNETLRQENSQLQVVAAENPRLKLRIAELAGVEDENRALQLQVEKLADVHATNEQLTQQLIDFAATQLQLLEVQKENHNLHTRLAEIATLQQENAGLRAQIENLVAIESENATLRNELRSMQSKHVDELKVARLETEKLQVRITALDQIQAENDQLLQQVRELRHAQATIKELETRLAAEEFSNTEQRKNQLAEWHVERAQTTAKLLVLEEAATQMQIAQSEAARLQAAETQQLRLELEEAAKQLQNAQSDVARLQAAESEAARLQTAETEQLRLERDRFKAQGDELGQLINALQVDKEYTGRQLSEAHELVASSRAEAAELRVVHDALREQLLKLEKSQVEYESLLALASDELTAEQIVISQLRQQLAESKTAPQADIKQRDDADTLPEPATEQASDSCDGEHDDTDSLPILRVPELQDDLKTIRGVGAKLEQKLNMIGICNFRDLVELEEKGFERATKLIPDLVNRIQRDNWMQQARDLHRHKYNEGI